MCHASLCCKTKTIHEIMINWTTNSQPAKWEWRMQNKRYLKWRTDILDSCCKRPLAMRGTVFAIKHTLQATPFDTSFICSLTYELTGIQSSLFSCSISKALARTSFCVLAKLSNAKILAYSGGRDSWYSFNKKLGEFLIFRDNVDYYYRITRMLLLGPRRRS